MGVHWSVNFKALGDKLCRVAPKTYFVLKLIRAFLSAWMGLFLEKFGKRRHPKAAKEGPQVRGPPELISNFCNF